VAVRGVGYRIVVDAEDAAAEGGAADGEVT
jgi:hypothetical protein